MKSYNEFCALSRTLDVVGDRWTMLIVRELLIGPCRYSDLQKSLPGIATNLLAQRLHTLEEKGVITSREEPAPVSAHVYSLTEWGYGLRAPLVSLARWGSPLMTPDAGIDHSRGRWLVFAIMALYPDPSALAGHPDLPEITVRIDTDDSTLLLVSDISGVNASLTHRNSTADVVVNGTPKEIFRLLSGNSTAQTRAHVTGDAESARRLTKLTTFAYTHNSAPTTSNTH